MPNPVRTRFHRPIARLLAGLLPASVMAGLLSAGLTAH
jgi:hypothetical protein